MKLKTSETRLRNESYRFGTRVKEECSRAGLHPLSLFLYGKLFLVTDLVTNV
jgi:hypothetical protein